jgi:heterotetrameric sarcosine oxidase gamma subunit
MSATGRSQGENLNAKREAAPADAPRYDVAVRQLAPNARFETRGKPGDLAAALRAAGLPVPERRNSSLAGDGQVRVDWLGPQRYVVTAPLAREEALGGALEAAFAGFAGADVACTTDMVVTFELAGSGAADVLAQGTPLDIGPASFLAASVTGTELWGVGVVVERPAADPATFRVTVERSYAGYVDGWLRAAAGLPADIRPGVMIAPPGMAQPS